ncbi:uncharacterized protein K460DRAFT_423041 [Cucurbitaria berberidis CBS 394.84]|uniref:Transmembrane protein n=1 Tax=Cucurbitaria berberidis CBS 394.84 TaxID=1168544 RepID=A0A9P4LD89_9PLEO|nr:uncharacterized protein K460DRAFT_423041 [Cucurbitaria berberidis CBS 394.84]KAF1850553.1 hypothetical protein K460DRAFT_423041 [Cucurbitaria berberidis CBS 394.84]
MPILPTLTLRGQSTPSIIPAPGLSTTSKHSSGIIAGSIIGIIYVIPWYRRCQEVKVVKEQAVERQRASLRFFDELSQQNLRHSQATISTMCTVGTTLSVGDAIPMRMMPAMPVKVHNSRQTRLGSDLNGSHHETDALWERSSLATRDEHALCFHALFSTHVMPSQYTRSLAYILFLPFFTQSSSNPYNNRERKQSTTNSIQQSQRSQFEPLDMADFLRPSLVIVTEASYVTVTPTAFLATRSSVLPTLSSTMDMASTSAHLSISSTSISMAYTSSSAFVTSLLTSTASQTGIPPLPSEFAEPEDLHPNPKFNDTFAIMMLVALSIMAFLLFTLIGYLIYLCCKGKCPKCKNMQEQVDKWERGELKHITTDMVRRREVLNNGSLSGSTVDLEMGTIDPSLAAALHDLQGRQRAMFWNGTKETLHKMKRKLMRKLMSKGKNNAVRPVQTRASADRFFTVEVPSQPPQVHCEPGDNRLYDPPSPSCYSQPTQVNGPRAFSDHTDPELLQPVRFKRDSAPRRSTYTAYMRDVRGAPNRSDNIRQAEAGLSTQEYQAAEHAMQRDSTTESLMRRALEVVNRADQEVQRARHPSRYSENSAPIDSEQDTGARNQARESYQMADWRRGPRKDGFF